MVKPLCIKLRLYGKEWDEGNKIQNMGGNMMLIGTMSLFWLKVLMVIR